MQLSDRLVNSLTGLIAPHNPLHKRDAQLHGMQVSDDMDIDEMLPIPEHSSSLHIASESDLTIASIDDSLSMSESEAETSISEGNLEQLSFAQLKQLLEAEDKALLTTLGITAEESNKAVQAGHHEIKKMEEDLKKLSSLPSEIDELMRLAIHHKMSSIEQSSSEENLAKLQQELQMTQTVIKRQLDQLQVICHNHTEEKNRYYLTLELDGKTHLIKAESEDLAKKQAENLLGQSTTTLSQEVQKERERLKELLHQKPLPADTGTTANKLEEHAELTLSNPISTVSYSANLTRAITSTGATGGMDICSGGLGIVAYGLTAKRALIQYQQFLSLHTQAAGLTERGYAEHAAILEVHAAKFLRRSLGLISQASIGLLESLAGTVGGVATLVSLFSEIGSGVSMGTGIALGALGIALGSIGAGLNIRNMIKASNKTTDVKRVMNHLLQRHALLPGTEDEVKLGLEICNMIKHKQDEKFFGNTTNLSVNTLVIAGGATILAASVGAASMGAAIAALAGTAAALAIARWYVIHKREVEAKDRQTWLHASNDLSTDQGLYVSLYFQVKSELEAREKLRQQGLSPYQSPAVFCDEICPLLGIDPESFVHAVDGLAEHFRQRVEVQRPAIVKGLTDRQESHSMDPVLTGRIKRLQESGEFGAMYRPDGLKTYQLELALQGKIEKKMAAMYKVEVKTHELLKKGKTAATSQQLQALNKKLAEYRTQISHYETKLSTLEEVHRHAKHTSKISML
jgi:hypothetical protein